MRRDSTGKAQRFQVDAVGFGPHLQCLRAGTQLQVHTDQTAPVIDFYRQQGELTVVDGVGSLDEVFTRITEALAPAKEVG